MDLKRIVSRVDRMTTSSRRGLRRVRKDILTLGEEKALRKMRRRAIWHSIMEREDVWGQNMAVYHFISSIYEKREDVRREYNRYKEIKQKMLEKYGIEMR